MNIEEIYRLFLQALKAALGKGQVTWEEALAKETWTELFRLAEEHRVLPMIFDAVHSCPSAKKADPGLFHGFRQRSIHYVMLQAIKTEEFLELYQQLKDAGFAPIVVKGIICRELYPNPDYRISSDEDILIPKEQYERCHETLLACGMICSNPKVDRKTAYEVPYRKKNGLLYIEVHKQLFPEMPGVYERMNAYFKNIEGRSVEIPEDVAETEGARESVRLITMNPTDYLFYLICHTFKHWILTGCGIRQVCDIIQVANAYGSSIDWDCIKRQCREIRADVFAAAVFEIGERYLNLDPERSNCPKEWRKSGVDVEPLLADILAGGVYGKSVAGRTHSGTVTSNMVIAGKRGGFLRTWLVRSVFPKADVMKSRYPFLERKVYLLPVAWGMRLLSYLKRRLQGREESVVRSVGIGMQRSKLLEQYGVISG